MVTLAPEVGADVVENLAARGNPHAQRLLVLAYRQAVAELLLDFAPLGDWEIALTSPALRVIFDSMSEAEEVLPKFDRYLDESGGSLSPADKRKLMEWLLEPPVPEQEARP